MAKASFIAIGVGQGDAFFLEREGLAVLIDGGRSVQGFPAQFQKVTNRDSVDILVCTHNDADHANGILGFLRSGLTCKEVWLPGSWTDRLDDLLIRPVEFMEELVSDIEKINMEKLISNIKGREELISDIEEIEVTPEKRLLLQALGDQYSERMTQQERDNEGAPSTTDALSKALEKATTIEDYWSIFLYPSPLWLPEDWFYFWYRMWRILGGDHRRFQLFIEAISAATLIREISLAAYHTGALIRWFEYDANSNSGVSDVLVPLNAHEILQLRVRRWSALEYLALTTSNKQSLVFISPASDEEPAVLFTADSDLSFSQSIPWSNWMIVTAPHHGSEANANAYRRFTCDTSNNLDVIWVRSDGRFKSRPGDSYLSVRGSRFCTLCRGSNYPKQDVRLMIVSGKWEPVFTRKCCCKKLFGL